MIEDTTNVMWFMLSPTNIYTYSSLNVYVCLAIGAKHHPSPSES